MDVNVPERIDANDNRSLVHPVASASTGYYGLPLLKKPVWTWEIPTYFFIGGAAGAAALLAEIAHLFRGDERLVRDARRIAAAGGMLAPVLLISDLGRPERFLYMLRVIKPQSPMSVGSGRSCRSRAPLRSTRPSMSLHRGSADRSRAASSAALFRR